MNCNEIQQNINASLIAFADCKKYTNSDLLTLVELIQALLDCDSSGSLEQDNKFVIINYTLTQIGALSFEDDIQTLLAEYISLQDIEINEIQLYIFKIQDVSLNNQIYILNNKGKGTLNNIVAEDLFLISTNISGIVSTSQLENDGNGISPFSTDDNVIHKTLDEEKIGNLTVRKLTGDAISATKADTGNAINSLVSGTNTHLFILNQQGGYIEENVNVGGEEIIRQKDAGNGLSFNSVRITPRNVNPIDESFGKADFKVQGNVKTDDAVVGNDVVTLNQLNFQDKFKSTVDMLDAESNAKIQSAGSWVYKLTDTETPRKLDVNYTPTWDRKIAKGTDVKFEKFVIVPPTVPGHNNDHAVLSDVGVDDVFYIAGVSDKAGRVYESYDYGKTLIQIADLKTQFGYSECGIWAIKELPNRELLVNMSVKQGLETHSYLYVSSNNKTTWELSVQSGGVLPIEFTYYKEVDGGGAITFEVFGRIVNGWGVDCYKNFVLVTEYGYPGVVGTSIDPTKDNVGHNITGKMFLSDDYGVSFNQVFDYINPPTGIDFVTYPGMHHGHGGFIDPYTINPNGFPRIVGIFGDAETRMVYSDDAGGSWYDGRNVIQGYVQAVSGMAVSGGYLTTPDSGKNTIQYTHRALNPSNMASEDVFFMMRDEDKLVPELQTGIVYVGGNIRQRSPGSPIVTLFTPETSGQYNLGARGGIAISYDEGRTWKEIWRDTEYGMFEGIQTAMVFETKDGGIWLSPTSTYPIDLGDGDGVMGRIIKLSVDKSDTTTKAEDDSVVHKTGNKDETVTGKKTFSQEAIFSTQATMGNSPVNFNNFELVSNASNGFGFELLKKNVAINLISVRSDNFNIGIGDVADVDKKLHVHGTAKINGTLEIAQGTANTHALRRDELTIVNTTTTDLSLATLNSTYPNAFPGFEVHCKDIAIGGPTIYKKMATTWVILRCIEAT